MPDFGDETGDLIFREILRGGHDALRRFAAQIGKSIQSAKEQAQGLLDASQAQQLDASNAYEFRLDGLNEAEQASAMQEVIIPLLRDHGLSTEPSQFEQAMKTTMDEDGVPHTEPEPGITYTMTADDAANKMDEAVSAFADYPVKLMESDVAKEAFGYSGLQVSPRGYGLLSQDDRAKFLGILREGFEENGLDVKDICAPANGYGEAPSNGEPGLSGDLTVSKESLGRGSENERVLAETCEKFNKAFDGIREDFTPLQPELSVFRADELGDRSFDERYHAFRSLHEYLQQQGYDVKAEFAPDGGCTFTFSDAEASARLAAAETPIDVQTVAWDPECRYVASRFERAGIPFKQEQVAQDAVRFTVPDARLDDAAQTIDDMLEHSRSAAQRMADLQQAGKEVPKGLQNLVAKPFREERIGNLDAVRSRVDEVRKIANLIPDEKTFQGIVDHWRDEVGYFKEKSAEAAGEAKTWQQALADRGRQLPSWVQVREHAEEAARDWNKHADSFSPQRLVEPGKDVPEPVTRVGSR